MKSNGTMVYTYTWRRCLHYICPRWLLTATFTYSICNAPWHKSLTDLGGCRGIKVESNVQGKRVSSPSEWPGLWHPWEATFSIQIQLLFNAQSRHFRKHTWPRNLSYPFLLGLFSCISQTFTLKMMTKIKRQLYPSFPSFPAFLYSSGSPR